LAVYRPQLKAPAKPVNMIAQKVDDRHPVIQHPAVVPAKSQHPYVASSPAPGNANRVPQGQNQGSWPRPAVDRAPAYSQPQPPPKLYRPSNASAPSTPSAPSANRPDSSRSAQPAVQPEQERSSSTHSSTTVPTQNSHSYYPKGYYQASETRVLPPVNEARPSDSHGQSSSSSHGQPSSSNGHQGGPPQKNDK
jgi:hypothetical protein